MAAPAPSGAESAPPRSDTVKIRSSVYLLGNYEVKSWSPSVVCSDSIALMLKLKNGTDMNLSLSFKHIIRVDIVDNSENEGAGLVLYVNNFMAQKIEKGLHFESYHFSRFSNLYAKHPFVILDILNSDRATIARLRNILEEAAAFHRGYIRKRFLDDGGPDPIKPPPQYIYPISMHYFKELLKSISKEVYVEDVTMRDADGGAYVYTVARIVNSEPGPRHAMQQDGRVVRLAEHDASRRYRTVEGPRLFAIGSMSNTDVPGAAKPRMAYAREQRVPARTPNEVHTIDDDATTEANSHNSGVIVATYQPNGKRLCQISEKDLQTLNPTDMLNDTIIDFYLNYILHSILDADSRDRIYVFNSFFYERLSKDVYSSRTPKLRSKKIADNYSSLKSWTKSVNIFDKDYIVVPVNEEHHWYVAVIVKPCLGFVVEPRDASQTPASAAIASSADTLSSPRSAEKSSSTPSPPPIPVFIFDSLFDPHEALKHRAVADLLLEYLSLEYNDKKHEHHLPGIAYRKSAWRVVVPENTPQQQNYYDCGVYMLQFAESFLRRLPKIEEISNTVHYDELFGTVDLNGKRDYIRKLITDMMPSAQ